MLNVNMSKHAIADLERDQDFITMIWKVLNPKMDLSVPTVVIKDFLLLMLYNINKYNKQQMT